MQAKTLKDIQADLKSGQLTCVQLVSYYLENIKKTADLNAYIEVFEAEILAKADDLDKKIQEKPDELGPLFGAVLSLKDNICYANHGVTAASKMLEGYISPYSATVVERALAADALFIGRTNCDQFGMGSSNENSIYGAVKNAADPERIPGGSSGGAAVSVQTDSCLAALGTDTGGSVRQPAAFCGVLGFKPTYGRISRYGILAYGSSFDQVGVLAKSTEDIAQIYTQIAGPDAYDATASQQAVQVISLEKNTQKPAKIAYFPQILESEALDPSVKKAIETHVEHLKNEGHSLHPVEFDLLDYIVPTYYVLTTAEASSNLGRYDGIRYGHRSTEASNLEETYQFSRTEGFSEEVKKRILLGTFVLSSGYYDAYYAQAQKVRRLLTERIAAIFEAHDFIFLPTSPSLPWLFGEKSDDPTAMYLSDIYTVLANLVAVPALAYPIGKDAKTGLSIGGQLMAPKWKEAELLEFFKHFSP